MKVVLLIILECAMFSGFAQSYNVKDIPDSLLKNAEAVERNYEMTTELKSPSRAVIHEKYAFTILNSKGDDWADYMEIYSKLRPLNFVSARLYDANGKELKHVKMKEMTDRPVTSEMTLADDDRYKSFSFHWQSYPYTVEIDEEYEFNGFFYLNSWYPQQSPDISVQTSKFVLISPNDYEIRYKGYQGAPAPVSSENKSAKVLTWSMSNITAREEEYFSPKWKYIEPFVLTGPSDFEIEGYKGNMRSWNDFGKFYNTLLQNRDILPDNEKKRVHELVDKLNDPKEKIAVLYRYMQNKTHYINVSLGIGGWQPFDATYVSTKGYGDCKALSNYMVALLKEAGIKGNSVIIRGGEKETDFIPDFVSTQFNHVICCVPLAKDTVWLECTSQYLPAGYLSEFTADRYCLMIDQQGGSLVHTPKYCIKDNIQNRQVEGKLDEDGNLQAAISTSYKAASQDDVESLIDNYSKEVQLNALKRNFDLPTFDILSLEYKKDYSGRLPIINEDLKMSVSNYAQVTGRRLFINPNLISRSHTKYQDIADRKYDIYLRDEFEDLDSVVIVIPSGYSIESMPHAQTFDTPFGKFACTVSFANNKITYTRHFFQYSGTFPPKKYNDLVKFYDDIYRADRSVVVLVKEKS